MIDESSFFYYETSSTQEIPFLQDGNLGQMYVLGSHTHDFWICGSPSRPRSL